LRSQSSPSILVFPYYTDNPYTDLLYSSTRASGYNILDTLRFDEFERDAARLGVGDVIHIQWTAPVWRGSRDERDAWLRLDRFQRLILRAQSCRVPLIWTVHNVLDHEARFVEPALALARFLARNAAAIHVMNAGTAQAAAHLYRLPESKVVVIPHSSYTGVYPTTITRQQARDHFAIGSDETALLFFGQMRPYKGLDTLFEAASELASNGRRLTLMLAGATHPDDLPLIERSVPRNLRVIRKHMHVDDNETASWFAAADVTVLPYRNVLNSGTALLSATFGVPVLLPDLPHLRAEFGEQSWVHLFTQELGGLRRTLEQFTPRQVEIEDALQFAASIPPRRMSDAFRTLVEMTRSASLQRASAGASAAKPILR
jgi:beta-1,4-mannosyltransferase